MLLLADQAISRVEFLHSRNLIHRDLKPDNFLMGVGKRANQLCPIDYGLAKNYVNPKTGLHVPYKENKGLCGTARYASLNTHLGVDQSRRDDMEALGYMFIVSHTAAQMPVADGEQQFLRGRLPWQGLKGGNRKEHYDKTMEKSRWAQTYRAQHR